ncbi:hypothetical protein [Calidifontibacillus erzurumensis]|uniref:Uncharacterized protein n=1 Tax=Calidifontibacillus erzurumensis TaxID=2741433 RepID=A0A8J8GCJ3_9BACI|nr:hypothetical protein [Calidifontibacillus erzurumensis]NSL51029.1 hypothetical protein [Calidifontibacillus erzurumensis]
MTEYEAASLLALGFGFLFLLFVFLLVFYILGAIGLYSMAKRANVGNEWLAFIPIGNAYIIGDLIDEKMKWFTIGKSGGIKLLIITIGTIVLNNIPVIGNIISILFVIFWLVVFHWLFEKYSESAVILTIVNIITAGIASPFIIFALRNKEARY